MPRWMSAAFFALMMALAAACSPSGDGSGDSAQTAFDTLTIETASGTQPFRIEFADTDEERRRGLMFREEMAADAGMLFDFEQSRIVTMWMRNTPLPLDMIFITSDGRVAHIAENTVPFSDAVISSRQPVLAVLEVNAGTARRLGISTGDRVRHPLFAAKPAGAAAE